MTIYKIVLRWEHCHQEKVFFSSTELMLLLLAISVYKHQSGTN